MQKIRIEISQLNPASIDLLSEAILQFSARLSEEVLFEICEEGDKDTITVPVSPGEFMPAHDAIISLSEILYVTSDRHYIHFVCKGRTCRSRLRFSDVQALLPADAFLQPCRGVLVSRSCIQSCTRTSCTMTDQSVFSISRGRREEFFRSLQTRDANSQLTP